MIPTTPPRTLRSIFTLSRRRNPSPLAQQFMPSPHLSSSPSPLLNAVADCSLLDTLKVGEAASKTLTPPDYLCRIKINIFIIIVSSSCCLRSQISTRWWIPQAQKN
ncbi:hypothetical protein ACFX13_036375 [Malus domestica]